MKRILFTFLVFVFTTNLFGQFSDARWITIRNNPSDTNQWLCFRKSFQILDAPKGMTIARIAVDSKYWLWINNQMVVFEGGLKRGPNPTDTYFDEVEISKYLKRGNNTIAILVWFFGKDGFSHKNSGKAGLLFEAGIASQKLVSDATWKVNKHPAYGETDKPIPNYRLSESNIAFDARKNTIEGWETTSFSDKQWESPVEVGVPPCEPWNKLWLRPVPLWKDLGLTPYVNGNTFPKESNGQILVAKLPKNITVTPYLKIDAPEGLTIDLRTDNYKGGSENNIRAEYITRKGVQEFEAFAFMNGHEVLYTIPKGVKIISLKYRETRFNTEFVGNFSCNDPFLNKLYEKSITTMNLNVRDQISDCPDRERAQWWGDVVITLGEMLYTCDANGFTSIKKAIYNLVDWQKVDGTLFSPVPAGNWDKELPLQMLASIGEFGFWRYYTYTGDTALIKYVYPHVKKYLTLWKMGYHGTVEHRTGAWDWADWGKNVDFGVLDNAWYYLTLNTAAKMAMLVGNGKDTAEYYSKMRTLKANFDNIYWTGNEYRSPLLKVTDDRANGLMVLSGLSDEDKWLAIRKVLENQFYASPYMEKYILEALFKMNMPDYGLKRMIARYKKMVESPITSLWEGWDINTAEFGGGTYNHGWTGGPLTLMAEYVAGIAPDAPGYTSYHVRPQLGGLTSVNCRTYTVRGMIEVKISDSEKRFTLTLAGPANTPVTLGVPERNYKSISVNNVKIWQDGKPLSNNLVSFVGTERGFIKFKGNSLPKAEIKAL